MCSKPPQTFFAISMPQILTVNIIHSTPGLNLNLDKSQCTGAIDSANNAVLSADFKNVIFKIIHWA